MAEDSMGMGEIERMIYAAPPALRLKVDALCGPKTALSNRVFHLVMAERMHAARLTSGGYLHRLLCCLHWGDWVQHDGTGDPSIPHEVIEAKFRDGDTGFGMTLDWDQNWSWKGREKEHDDDIIAYRQVRAATPKDTTNG